MMDPSLLSSGHRGGRQDLHEEKHTVPSTQTHDFRIGEKAVYPAHGVAEVVGIEKKEINTSVCSFYVLKVLATGMQILVQREKAEQKRDREDRHRVEQSEGEGVAGRRRSPETQPPPKPDETGDERKQCQSAPVRKQPHGFHQRGDGFWFVVGSFGNPCARIG